SFARSSLYQETFFPDIKFENLKKLIQAVELIINNSHYKLLVEKHLNAENLRALIVDLIQEYRIQMLKNKIQKHVNTLVNDIQSELRLHTTVPKIENIDFNEIAKEILMKNKFNDLVFQMRKEKIINSEVISDFTIETRRRVFTG